MLLYVNLLTNECITSLQFEYIKLHEICQTLFYQKLTNRCKKNKDIFLKIKHNIQGLI